jgi:uncharacterized membrane protein YraQ (UPF0718 family)
MDKREQNDDKGKKSVVNYFYKALKSFGSALPMVLGIILLLGLFQTFVSDEMISSIFTGELLRDTFIGSIIGSISAGNPMISYIMGGNF